MFQQGAQVGRSFSDEIKNIHHFKVISLKQIKSIFLENKSPFIKNPFINYLEAWEFGRENLHIK